MSQRAHDSEVQLSRNGSVEVVSRVREEIGKAEGEHPIQEEQVVPQEHITKDWNAEDEDGESRDCVRSRSLETSSS